MPIAGVKQLNVSNDRRADAPQAISATHVVRFDRERRGPHAGKFMQRQLPLPTPLLAEATLLVESVVVTAPSRIAGRPKAPPALQPKGRR